MGKIEELRTSILSMTPEERLERVKQIRLDRRVYKNPEKEKKARKQKAASKDKLVASLKGMTLEQLKELGLVP